jgi:selenocysteine lyase/cysteine desulfurase
VVRPDLAEALPNQGHFFNAGTVTKRLTPAGPDHAQIAACAGIADYIDALAAHHGVTGDARSRNAAVHERMRAQEAAVAAPLLDYVSGRNDLRLIGPADPATRAPTVALDLGRPAEPVAAALAAHRVMAGGGHFYAVRPLRAMGVDTERGVLRLSFVHYTSPAEVDRLIAALDAVL